MSAFWSGVLRLDEGATTDDYLLMYEEAVEAARRTMPAGEWTQDLHGAPFSEHVREAIRFQINLPVMTWT